MFGKLINEAALTLWLYTESPLSIRSAQGKLLDPRLPDMQCIKSSRNGRDTVIIPGSSLKGVLRSRYEKCVRLLGGDCCDILNPQKSCKRPEDWKEQKYEKQGRYVYERLCPACRLFGSGAIASRISIADAYPVEDGSACLHLGFRTGTAINRITGGVQKGALYEYEVVEEGTFLVHITLKNYELYQMKLLLLVLRDMDDGFVTLGAGATSGNGRMRTEKLEICLREYRQEAKGWKGALEEDEIPLEPAVDEGYDWSEAYFGSARLSETTVYGMLDRLAGICIEKYVGGA